MTDREPGVTDRELLVRRERLVERFAAMQLDLGGVYYEMAIRDHIRHDVLMRKAAELQRVDVELGDVEQQLASNRGDRPCPACGAAAQPAAAFCARCGERLAPTSSEAPSPR
jgi:hypothetical protein